MIRAEYHSNLMDDKIVSFEASCSRLTIINGKQARSFFEIASLRGFATYSGVFEVDDYDFLSPMNTKRDRQPVSVIVASSKQCQVSRSQIPLGSTPKTEKIDMMIKRYLDEGGVNQEQQELFTKVMENIYAELCAHPLYVILDLSRMDKNLSCKVLDLCNKVLGSYKILVYAPQLFSYPTEDIVFYEDIKSIIEPKPEKVEEPKPQYSVRDLAMSYFIDDLYGNVRQQPARQESNEMTRPIEETSEIEKDPAPARIINREKEAEPEQPKPVVHNELPEIEDDDEDEKGFFSFDPKKTDLYNFIFACIFFILSIVISFTFFTFKSDKIPTFFWICLLMAIVFFAMSLVPVKSLWNDNPGKKFRDSKFLFAAEIFFPAASIIVAIVIAAMGANNLKTADDSSAWTQTNIVVYSVIFVIYAVVFPTFLQLLNRFAKKKPSKE